MFSRLVTLQLQPGKTEEAVGIYRDSVIPAAKKQHGFKGALLLTDASTGKVFSITEWETEADMKAGEASGYYREQIAKFAHLSQLYVTPPYREVYELIIQE